MIPQRMRPIIALLTMVLGVVVIANHWLGFVESEIDLITHAVGLIGLFSGMNMMSPGSANETEEKGPRYLEDTQTKF